MSNLITYAGLIIAFFACSCDSVWTSFELVRPWRGQGSTWSLPYVKISSVNSSGPVVPTGALFGISVTNIGDLDGNGVDDLIVGAAGERSLVNDTISDQAGAIYVLFMQSSGVDNLDVLSHQRISSNENSGPALLPNAFFGYSSCSIGDLDGDGVNEVAVGAPGARLSSAYILFLRRNGTVRDRVIVGDRFDNLTYIEESSRIATGGPSLGYYSRFGSMVAPMGDFDEDGVPDLCIGSADASGGSSKVYIMYMLPDGNIKDFVVLSSGFNGAPIYDTFTNFGSSLVQLGDVDNDGVPDIAVGASLGTDGQSARFGSGVIYTCLMHRNGTIKSHTAIHALSQADKGFPLPLLQYDNCGTAITSIGDINKDDYQGKRPWKLQPLFKKMHTIPDVIVGCPQGDAGTLPGRAFIFYLAKDGGNQGYSHLPSVADQAQGISPKLQAKDQFGAALSAYMDVDGNGINEIIVGAPGDHTSTYNSGAIYILFLRRRRYHPPVFDWWTYYISIFVPIGTYCVCCIAGIKFFFWYYRRRPDMVEIMVKNSDIEIGKTRTRKKEKFVNKVHVDSYEL